MIHVTVLCRLVISQQETFNTINLLINFNKFKIIYWKRMQRLAQNSPWTVHKKSNGTRSALCISLQRRQNHMICCMNTQKIHNNYSKRQWLKLYVQSSAHKLVHQNYQDMVTVTKSSSVTAVVHNTTDCRLLKCLSKFPLTHTNTNFIDFTEASNWLE